MKIATKWQVEQDRVGWSPSTLHFEMLPDALVLFKFRDRQLKEQNMRCVQQLSKTSYQTILTEMNDHYTYLVSTVRLVTNLTVQDAIALLATHGIHPANQFSLREQGNVASLAKVLNDLLPILYDVNLMNSLCKALAKIESIWLIQLLSTMETLNLVIKSKVKANASSFMLVIKQSKCFYRVSFNSRR